MSSQQFPRHVLPASSGGTPQIPAAGNLVSVSQPSNLPGNSLTLKRLAGCFTSGEEDICEIIIYAVKLFSIAGPDGDSNRDADHGQQDHPPAGGGGTLSFRDDKQETMVVRPYPQVQTHGQPQAAPQTVSIQPGTPVTVPASTVHHAQGQPAVLTEGQMKVIIVSLTVQTSRSFVCIVTVK